MYNKQIIPFFVPKIAQISRKGYLKTQYSQLPVVNLFNVCLKTELEPLLRIIETRGAATNSWSRWCIAWGNISEGNRLDQYPQATCADQPLFSFFIFSDSGPSDWSSLNNYTSSLISSFKTCGSSKTASRMILFLEMSVETFKMILRYAKGIIIFWAVSFCLCRKGTHWSYLGIYLSSWTASLLRMCYGQSIEKLNGSASSESTFVWSAM